MHSNVRRLHEPGSLIAKRLVQHWSLDRG